MDSSMMDDKVTSHDPAERREAALVLAGQGNEEAIDRLVGLLEDSNSGVRDAAFNGLLLLGGRSTVERLVPLLSRQEISVRNSAMDLLRKVGEDGLDILHFHASHSNDNVRLFICDILGSIARAESLDTLMKGLSDENPNVRNACVISLGVLGDPKALPILEPMLSENDEHEWIRFSVIEALAKIPHGDAVDFLVDELERRSDDEMSVLAILEALGNARSPQSLPVLTSMLRDAAEGLQSALVSTILTILPAHDIVTLGVAERTLIKTRVETLLLSAEDEPLLTFLAALCVIGDTETIPVLIELASQREPDTQPRQWDAIRSTLVALNSPVMMLELLDHQEKLQILAAEVLAQCGGEEEARRIAQRVPSAHGYAKRSLVDALARIGGPSHRDLFVTLLDDDDGHVITAALRALSVFGTAEDSIQISVLLSHRYPDVRAAALNAVAKIGGETAQGIFMSLIRGTTSEERVTGLQGLYTMQSPLLKDAAVRLSTDHDPGVRAASVRAIRDNTLDVGRDLILSFLGDDHAPVRQMALDLIGARKINELRACLDEAADSSSLRDASHALESLGQFRDEDAKRKLLEVLETRSEFLRITAAKSLGRWEDASLVRELELYADDDNLDVARAVSEAIDRLQGVSF